MAFVITIGGKLEQILALNGVAATGIRRVSFPIGLAGYSGNLKAYTFLAYK